MCNHLFLKICVLIKKLLSENFVLYYTKHVVNILRPQWQFNGKKSPLPEQRAFVFKKGIAYRVYNPSGSDFSRHGRFDDLSDRTGRTKLYLFRWICHTDKESHVLLAAIAWILPDSFLLRELPGNWPKFGIVFPLASHQFLECLLKKVRQNEIALWQGLNYITLPIQ